MRTRFASLFAATLLSVAGCGGDDSGAAAGAAGAAGSGAGSTNPLSYDLSTAGPFHTGYKNWTTTYVPKTGAEPRTIKVHVWYPTKDVDGDGPHYLGVGDELENASLAPSPYPDGKYPVRVHSHGSQSFAAAGSAIHRHFASHGWVTVAPDHTGNLLAENLDPRPFAMYAWRSLDVAQALDFVAALPASEPLAGKAATDRVLITGHSFGGFTTWASAGAAFDTPSVDAMCAKEPMAFAAPCTAQEKAVFAAGLFDSRIVAAAPLAGGAGSTDWFGQTGQNAVKVPLLQMSGGADPVGAAEMMARVSGIDVTWVEVAGGCHELFSLGGCKEVPSAEGYQIVETYLLALGRKHVLADGGAAVADVLSGKTVVSSRVSFQRKTP